MNEDVKSVYIQMFAPEEVPPTVIALFDRINFLRNRIGAPAKMTPMELAIIGAVGENGLPAKPLTVMEKVVSLGTIDTTDRGEPEDEPPALPTEGHGPTGPMDAPARARHNPEITRRALETMDPAELRSHARECFKVDLPGNMGKAKLINKIMALQKGG